MTHTNISYEVCALLILIVVFIHMNARKQVKNFTNRFFFLFTFCGVIDVLLDIATTIMEESPGLYSEWMMGVAVEAFYLFQLLMPYLLILYILSLREALNRKGFVYIVVYSSISILMGLLVVTNAATGLFFHFADDGVRIKGPLFIGLYIYAFVYLITALIQLFAYRKLVKHKYYLAVWEFVLITCTAMAIQMFFPEVLLTGVGISVSIIVLLLTIQNPNNVTDNLTGVFSLEGMNETLAEYKENRVPYGMIVIALDNLKRINYIFGMEYGDELLRKIAEQLCKTVEREHVFRFIGDRFVLIVPEQEEYQRALQSVVEYFQNPIQIHATEVTVSTCICSFPVSDKYSEMSEVNSFMEYAVESAKAQGVGTIMDVDDELLKKYNRRRIIESYLIVAIERDLFEMNYQPIYSLKEKRFVSMEALVRLSHPQLGNISPAEFIPIAEKSGNVAMIDQLAFDHVCSFIAMHRKVLETMKHIKFNISPADLMDVNLCDKMITTLNRYHLEAKIFQFEITETTATMYTEHVKSWSDRIQEMGAQLCLDDFGSEYANMDAVVALPYRIIKIDRTMLLAAMESQMGADFYRGIVLLLKTLEYKIVAEGAETEEHIAFLQNLDVDYIQGYYYARPMSEDAILELTVNND